MKILNKFIWSKKEPSNKNDIWFDGSTWRMYTEEAWQSFTLPVDAADKVAKVLENASEVYQEKLNAGYGIIIDGNTISLDVSSIDVNTTHNIGSIELFEQIIAERRDYNLTQEDKDAILNGKIITTSVGNRVVPIISSNSMGENGVVLIFHFNERLYNMFVMWTDTICYINGFFSFTKETKLYADSELSETSENAVQNKVVTEKFTELSAEIEGIVGGESIVYDETKVQRIRYMKVEEPFVKGQTLEITLTENAATMSQGINIYRVVSATAMYIIGHFDAVGQTINVVLEDDAPQGLQFENLDANTTYGVRVIAKSVIEGKIVEVEKEVIALEEMVTPLTDIVEISKDANLFNKAEYVSGYIIESTGDIYDNGVARCSAQIPIKGGHYYLLSGRDAIGTTGLRCLDANGKSLKPLVASSGVEWERWTLPKEDGSKVTYNGEFKVPSEAVFVQFSTQYGGNGAVDSIMLTDLGTSYIPNPPIPSYQSYGSSYTIKEEALPHHSNLYGKSVIFTGDSICHATTDYTDGGGWAKRIGKKHNMTWVNRAISGGTITSKEVIGGYFTISETDFGNGADYIILEGGTNDADRIGSILNGEKPAAFGSWTIGDYTSEFTNDTFCGALEMMLKKVITDFPSAKVGFIIAMKMGQTGQGYTAEKYNRRAYFETIIQICHKWGVPVLNLWDNCTMNPKIPTHTELYADGQHPTGKGYDFITPIIEAWMKTL